MGIGSFNYIWKPALHFRAGRPHGIESIIMHSTEGRESGDLATLVGGDGRSVSVHWYVTRAGKVYHMVQDGNIANHAGNTVKVAYSNERSIGIEQEHFDGREDWPEAQLDAVAKLLAFLQQKHGMLPIVSHKVAAAPPGRKSDPEPYPWEVVRKKVVENMSTHWSANAV